MKKAWDDVKSFITIVSTIVYLACIALKIDIPEYFRNVYLMEISFYFGTQFQKASNKIKGSENSEGV